METVPDKLGCMITSSLQNFSLLVSEVKHRGISSVLCDDLEGWDREGGRETQEGADMEIYVCIWLIHFVVQQKLTQYCEAIILQ